MSLPMSHLIAPDAPLLSPIVDDAPDTFAYPYNPPSPPTSIGSSCTDNSMPTARMLKMHMGSDSGSESDQQQQLCLPTRQVFNGFFSEVSSLSSSPAPSSPTPPRLSITINHPQKRSGPGAESPTTTVGTTTTAKKARSSGERISSKDFIPPDVSGLSKREARLVKNRAAAFLSRQRKREEYECMEARVAELEQENARLMALARGKTAVSSETEGMSALEQLRSQLAAAEERERELSAELARKSATAVIPVKMEPTEPQSPSKGGQGPHRPAIGLMVLLCALPTLLSMSSSPFSVPPSSLLSPSASSSVLDFSSLIPNDYDWSRTLGGSSLMDLDADPRFSAHSKLEFTDGLDISFDTTPSSDGKIRVRIHSPVPTDLTSAAPLSIDHYSSYPFSNSIYSSSTSLPSSRDPFLGVGMDTFSHYTSDGTMNLYGDGKEESLSSSIDFGRRRVRIALKSLPAKGGEGGEWEVQFC